MYYCDHCFCHIVNVVPRYRIKVRVCDNSASTVFVLFDRDGYYMLKKSCSDMVVELKKLGVVCNYPSELDSRVGKTLLFKVEINGVSLSTFDTSYTVRRVCDDEIVLNLFGFDGRSFTHDKDVFPTSFNGDFNLKHDGFDDTVGLGKSLMLGFDEVGTCGRSVGESSSVKATSAKRVIVADTDSASSGTELTMLKRVKIEKV